MFYARLLTRTALAVAFTATVLTAPVLAGDAKVYPGGMCHADVLSSDPFIAQRGIGAFNLDESKQRRSVSCPIVRDNTQNTNGLESLVVRVQTNHSFDTTRQPLDCEINSRDPFGNTVERTSFRVTSNGNAERVLFMAQSRGGGYYEFRCDLPFQGGILSYTATEP